MNSAMMLTQKVTFGVGVLVAGLTVDYAGFAGVTTIEDVTYEMSSRLAWVYGPGLAAVTLLGALVYRYYRLDAKRYEEIRVQLDSR